MSDVKTRPVRELQVPRLPFQHLVREIAQEFKADVRFQSVAIGALQVAAEAYLEGIYEEATVVAGAANRTTVRPRDMRLAQRMLGKIA